MGKASLWTDSRYWTQAERQMDCNWELHKEGRRFLGKVQVRVPARPFWAAVRSLGRFGAILTFETDIMEDRPDRTVTDRSLAGGLW